MTTSTVLYTISNLIIADAFPLSKQSLAGGVFNTVAQIGNSVGLAITAVIASTVAAARYPNAGNFNSDNSQTGSNTTNGTMSNNGNSSGGNHGESGVENAEAIIALLEGYRATFWTCFAAILFVAGVSAVGLRKAGKVGLKKE